LKVLPIINLKLPRHPKPTDYPRIYISLGVGRCEAGERDEVATRRLCRILNAQIGYAGSPVGGAEEISSDEARTEPSQLRCVASAASSGSPKSAWRSISQGEDRVVDLLGERLVVVENHGVPDQTFPPKIVKRAPLMPPYSMTCGLSMISHFIKS